MVKPVLFLYSIQKFQRYEYLLKENYLIHQELLQPPSLSEKERE